MQFFDEVGLLCATGEIVCPIVWDPAPNIFEGPIGRMVNLDINGRKFKARIAHIGPVVPNSEGAEDPEGSTMDVSFDSVEEIK